jgi:Lon protease-like protein
MTSSDSSHSDFSGRAALFPLPDATLFPNVMLPLHVFEPRYRCMVEDVLKSDRYLAIALLRDGWQEQYESKSCPIHETVCLSRVIADERLQDGRYYLLMQGLTRARLIVEEQTDLPYRIGQVDPIPDLYPHPPVIDRTRRQEELVGYFRQVFPKLDLDSTLFGAVKDGVPLGELCDLLAHALRPSPEDAQRLLDQVDVDQRSDLLLELLKLQCRDANAQTSRKFPPGFSLN